MVPQHDTASSDLILNNSKTPQTRQRSEVLGTTLKMESQHVTLNSGGPSGPKRGVTWPREGFLSADGILPLPLRPTRSDQGEFCRNGEEEWPTTKVVMMSQSLTSQQNP